MPQGRGRGWWCKRFRGDGYRVTVSREAVLAALAATSKHLSAEDVFLAVKRSNPGVGLTTVYRTLDLLMRMGIVLKYDFGDGRARYELASSADGAKKHHHHMICTNCERIIDYTDFIDDEVELLKRTEKGLSKKFNFKITDHLIQFYGICDRCASKAD